MSESEDIREIRRHFNNFENNVQKPEGLASLADALAAIFDIRENSAIDDDKRKAENLFKTYSRRAENHAQFLIDNLDSFTDNELENWYDVMKYFTDEVDAPTETFTKRMNVLIVSVAKRVYKNLSPQEQRNFLRELGVDISILNVD